MKGCIKMKNIIFFVLFSLLMGCSTIDWAIEDRRLETNAEYMMHRYGRSGPNGTFLLFSPHKKVNVILTRGEWFGTPVECNYIVERNDSTIISSRDGIITILSGGNYVPIVQN